MKAAAVVLAIVIPLGLVGSRSPKAEFISQADAICAELNARLQGVNLEDTGAQQPLSTGVAGGPRGTLNVAARRESRRLKISMWA